MMMTLTKTVLMEECLMPVLLQKNDQILKEHRASPQIHFNVFLTKARLSCQPFPATGEKSGLKVGSVSRLR